MFFVSWYKPLTGTTPLSNIHHIMEAFFLPNGQRIDHDLVVNAMLTIVTDDFPQSYLDRETGEIIEIQSAEALRDWVLAIGASNRYYLIPTLEDGERDSLAIEYTDELLAYVTPSYVDGAHEAILSGGWRAFEEFLIEKTAAEIHGWQQFVADDVYEQASDWLTSPEIGARAEFTGCGDCAICQLMKDGKGNDLDALQKAFATEHIMANVAEQMKVVKKSSTKKANVKARKDQDDKPTAKQDKTEP